MSQKFNYLLTVYLRGGHVVEVYCEEHKFRRDPETGQYVGYNISGLREGSVVSFSIPDIVGYSSTALT